MKFQASLSRITFDPRFLSDTDKFVEETTREAARIWVKAVLAIIPEWSGASRATVQALATAVGEYVSIDVKSEAPNRIALGRLYSSGGLKKNGQGSWEFYYETQLRYLIANETKKVAPRTEGLRGSLIQPTPYQFRDAGNRAVEAYLATIKFPVIPLIGKSL